MPSQLFVGKQLRRIGKAIQNFKQSRRLSPVGSGGISRPYLTGLFFFLILPLSVAGILYSTVTPQDLNEPPQQVATSVPIRLPDIRNQITPREILSEPLIHTTFVRDNDTLNSLMARLHIRDPLAREFIISSPQSQALIWPKKGSFVSTLVDEHGKIISLSLYSDSDITNQGTRLHITRENGQLVAQVSDFEFAVEQTLVSGVVRNNIESSLEQHKVPDSIVNQLYSAFDVDRNIVTEMGKGDSFRLIYETKFAQGQFIRNGRLLALQLEHKGKITELYWFGQDGSGGHYYDHRGNISVRTFMRVPLDIKSVSSEFSPMRKHPVTGVLRPHYGTDFRAPWGAVIRAAADGIVDFAGVGTGYGNYVRIKHGPHVQTLYAHMSSFEKGIRRGVAVKHGQIIGRVGATGLATGPHLHYELKYDGLQINPMTVRLPDTQMLSPYRFAQLEVMIAPLRAKLHLLQQIQSAGLSDNLDNTL